MPPRRALPVTVCAEVSPGGEAAQAGEEGVPVGAEDDGAVFEVGASGGQCVGDRPVVRAGVGRAVVQEGAGLTLEGVGGAGAERIQGTTGTVRVVAVASLLGASAVSSASGSAGGASSRMTWALVPETPKADTPVRRGRSVLGQSTGSVSRRTSPSVQSTLVVGVSTCRVRGRRSWRRAWIILMTPPTPAAAWVWPMFDLSEPSHSGRPSGRSWP